MSKERKINVELYNQTRAFLREKRIALGMSTGDVALAINGNRKDNAAICRIETGDKKGLTLSVLEEYLKLYNCEIVFKEN